MLSLTASDFGPVSDGLTQALVGKFITPLIISIAARSTIDHRSLQPTRILQHFQNKQNKLASLEAMLVGNYDQVTDRQEKVIEVLHRN